MKVFGNLKLPKECWSQHEKITDFARIKKKIREMPGVSRSHQESLGAVQYSFANVDVGYFRNCKGWHETFFEACSGFPLLYPPLPVSLSKELLMYEYFCLEVSFV